MEQYTKASTTKQGDYLELYHDSMDYPETITTVTIYQDADKYHKKSVVEFNFGEDTQAALTLLDALKGVGETNITVY